LIPASLVLWWNSLLSRAMGGEVTEVVWVIVSLAPFHVGSVAAVRDACYGRWLFVALAGAVGVVLDVSGRACVVRRVFCVYWTLCLEVLMTSSMPEGVRMVAGARGWVRRMLKAELSEAEREEVLLYAEAAGMSRRFIRNFPPATDWGC
jgi:hypothetical protein